VIAIPQALEDAAWDAARAELGDAPLADGALGRAVVDRSARYPSERDRLASPAEPKGDLAARATFFTVADAMKVAVPLRELAARGAIPARAEPLRVIDVGAGCGAMTLGALAAIPDRDMAIIAIDRDAGALRIAARAVRAFGGAHVAIETRAGDVRELARAPRGADLVLMGSVLNELADAAAREAAVVTALAAISDAGAVVIVEPALRDTTRALHELRDSLLARAAAHVFAPCTRTCAPCPALADDRDWCHEDRAVTLPQRTRELARRTHLRDSGLRFSYLVLRRAPLALVDAGDAAWRVVSAPRPDKGKLELTGCSQAGRIPLRRLRRHRSASNAAIERADRGAVLVIDAAPADDRVEIVADTRVDRISR
jgi:ribosomal protein RSM22 (predicted rRNA methylase)